ncbi:hypothetical protein [Salinisphaera sp. T31B1]|uniref:hypothetical protein n=1 Tax=Salinisphaera sp. T31B1 TaxID=727963 RepID=UPI0033409981
MNSPLELTRQEIELTVWRHLESGHEPLEGHEPDAFADHGVYVVADVRGYTLLHGTTPLGNELSLLVNWVCHGEKNYHLPGMSLYHPPVPDLVMRPSLTLLEFAIVIDVEGRVLNTSELARVLATSIWSSKWLKKAVACLPRNPHIVTRKHAAERVLTQID